MGILEKFFGARPDYPQLDASDPAARQIEAMRQPLEKLANEVKDPLEVVPADESVYVLVGKPPKKFGMAWVEDGDKIVNFKSLVDDKGLDPSSLSQLSEELTRAYEAHQDKPRYTTKISNRQVVVIPSSALSDRLKNVVKETVG